MYLVVLSCLLSGRSICTIAAPGLHAAQPRFMRPGHFLNKTVPNMGSRTVSTIRLAALVLYIVLHDAYALRSERSPHPSK